MGQPARNRRSFGRAQEGDAQSCPFCRAGLLQFYEHHPTEPDVGPVWLCQNGDCGYRVLPRRRQLTQRAIDAKHESMRAVARADELKRTAAELGRKRAGPKK